MLSILLKFGVCEDQSTMINGQQRGLVEKVEKREARRASFRDTLVLHVGR